MPSRTVSWTAQNRIDQVTTSSGVSVVYGLDPLGRTLTRTTTAGGVSKSASHHCAADADSPSWTVDVDGGVTTVSRYVNAGGGLVATQVMGGGVSFPLFTPHGDVWASTDGSGNVTATFSYDEYGNPLQVATGDEGVDRYGWLGRQQREWDPEVGITLMGVRGYDPTLGRFLSVDPVYGGSANAYDYVAGDPINGYDLDGHAGFWNKIKKTAKRARAWIRSRDFGTAAAGVFNIAYGNLRMVSGAATVVASVGLLGTPFAPLGIAGIVVGGSSGFLGAARTVRGATQVARVLRAPCVSRCGFSGHVSRFVRGILPNFSGTWLDKLGGF